MLARQDQHAPEMPIRQATRQLVPTSPLPASATPRYLLSDANSADRQHQQDELGQQILARASQRAPANDHAHECDHRLLRRDATPCHPQDRHALDSPCCGVSSSRFEDVGSGGVFVVVGVGFQAAVEDADEPVGELAEGGLVPGAAGAECHVVGAGSW